MSFFSSIFHHVLYYNEMNMICISNEMLKKNLTWSQIYFTPGVC